MTGCARCATSPGRCPACRGNADCRYCQGSGQRDYGEGQPERCAPCEGRGFTCRACTGSGACRCIQAERAPRRQAEGVPAREDREVARKRVESA